MADTSSPLLETTVAPSSTIGTSTVNPSTIIPNKPQPRKNDSALRQGKWTREEEEYVHCLIDEFKTGMMPLAEGTSLRTFLSKMLNCHPMRISKKFVGSNYNGKQVYARRTGKDRLSNDQVRARRTKLCSLERKFLAKIQGKAGAASTPAASSAMPQLAGPSTNSLQQLPGTGLGSNVAMSRVSASGVELRNLINQATTQSHGGGHLTHQSDLPRNISLLEQANNSGGFMPQNSGSSSNNLASSQSLQNLFADLVNSNSTGSLNNSTSLEAFQMLMQQHQPSSQSQQQQYGANQHGSNHHQKANSRAAAAGRALLQGLGGLGGSGEDQKKAANPNSSNSMSSLSNKPLSDFTSAELAAELQKRSSLQDLVASLKNGGDVNNATSKNASQQQNSTFANLIRESSLASVDMSNLIERQGSIDSLSNLGAIRSQLHQSLQSMGSLFDKMGSAPDFAAASAGGSSGNSQNNNTTWTAAHHGQQQSSSTNDLMSSFFGSNGGSADDLRAAIGNSGLDLSSLLNNDDALRQLDASAPSSLNQNFHFQSPAAAAGPQGNGGSSRSAEKNTAIAQFLLQKKLLEQQQKRQAGSNSNFSGGGSNGRQGNDARNELMRNVAAVSGGGSTNSGDGGSSMDPIMSSLLSRLQANSSNSQSAAQRENNGQDSNAATVEALKRKFFGGGSSQDFMDGQNRRNKPFR